MSKVVDSSKVRGSTLLGIIMDYGLYGLLF